MRQTDPRFTLPPPSRRGIDQALIAFVTGKLQRTFWSPQPDMTARKLSAIAALALDSKATPALLDSLDIDPLRWPTHSVLDWLTVLEHVQLPRAAPSGSKKLGTSCATAWPTKARKWASLPTRKTTGGG